MSDKFMEITRFISSPRPEGVSRPGQSTRAAELLDDVLHILPVQRGFSQHVASNDEVAVVWGQVEY